MKPRLLANEHMTERQIHVHEHLQLFRLHTRMLLAYFETGGVHFACHLVLCDFLDEQKMHTYLVSLLEFFVVLLEHPQMHKSILSPP
jgi:hypothetical protein